jgi:hypothetical protein
MANRDPIDTLPPDLGEQAEIQSRARLDYQQRKRLRSFGCADTGGSDCRQNIASVSHSLIPTGGPRSQ